MENTKSLRQLTEELTLRDEKLLESEKLFRSAFCVNPMPMSLTAMDGRFIKVNKALCNIVGMREEDLIGKIPKDFELYADYKQRDCIVEILTSGKSINNKPVIFNTRNGVVNTLLSALVVKIEHIPYILAVFLIENNLKESIV